MALRMQVERLQELWGADESAVPFTAGAVEPDLHLPGSVILRIKAIDVGAGVVDDPTAVA